MYEADERPKRPLPIDPQPRRDLEVPPMVSAPQSQGLSSIRTPEPKRPDVENLFAGLDFSASH